MEPKNSRVFIILILAVFFGFAGSVAGSKFAGSNSDDVIVPVTESGEPVAIPGEMTKVVQALGLIENLYLGDAETDQLVSGAVQGMVQSLGDRNSSYMDAETMNQFSNQMESSFQGIGAQVSMVNGMVTIVSPVKDSPAEQAGLLPNDQVLSIDGESTENLNLNEAVSKIRGEEGTEVVLEIKRPGVAEPFEVTVTREDIPVETVYSRTEMVDGEKTGVIELTSFSENTGTEFREQLDMLESEGIEGLVIDVRGNPGGLLTAVGEIVSLFVPEEVPYVQIEDSNGEKMPLYSDTGERKDYPISVVIDGGSASASEILAVAMKELGYDVVGASSFGKGTVQQAVPLGDGSTVKLTTSRWLSPQGNWVNESGVAPTIEARQPAYYYTAPLQLEDPLKYDSTGPQIANMQTMLTGIGYDTGRTDGYFSEATVSAVQEFQRDQGIEATGVVNQDTANLIQTSVMERIASGEDDRQMDAALSELYQ